MNAAFVAGLLYGLAIFGLGFALGALRELVLAPVFGRSAVVAVEAPAILLVSWFLAGRIIGRRAVPPRLSARLAMGAVGLALVLAGEAAIAVLGFGRSLPAHLAAYLTQRGMLELLPQLAFALLPALHLLRERSRS